MVIWVKLHKDHGCFQIYTCKYKVYIGIIKYVRGDVDLIKVFP